MQASILPLGQQEAITDCAYDFYGLRLASCSVDAKIRLFRLNESTGEWASESEWRAHDAPMTRVSWAHPEHGALIASASFDRTVKVWQEAERVSSGPGSQSPPRWVERAVLTEAKGSVRDVAFAPSHFGLKLATISSDSMLRVYECLEIYNASSWQLTVEEDLSSFTSSAPGSSGHNEGASPLYGTPGTVQTPGGESSSPVSSDGILRRSSTPSIQAHGSRFGGPGAFGAGSSAREAESGWCLSWCKEKWWGEVIAVSTGTIPSVKIIALPPSPNRPILLASLDHRTSSHPPSSASTSSITSLSWAPMSGRSYHLIATGSKDSYVRIWKVKPGVNVPAPSNQGPPIFGGVSAAAAAASTSASTVGTGASLPDEDKWTHVLAGEFGDHKSAVGRVEWNVTGTVLSSAGDDGQIRFWKALSNVWRKIGAFNTHHVVEDSTIEAMEEE